MRFLHFGSKKPTTRWSLILAVMAVSLFACDTPYAFNRDKVEQVLTLQATSWNNGDIDAYMEGYWKSDSLRFVTAKRVTYGWTNVKDRYKAAYPDKAAMGRLHFDLLHVDPIEKEHAQVNGKWTLYRESDTLGGHFFLLMRRIGNEWKIVVDATS